MLIDIPNKFKKNKPFHINKEDLPEKYHKLFYWDAGVSNYGFPRTQWMDNEEKTKVITPRGKAQNWLCIDSGSTDLFFGFELISKLNDKTIEPAYQGMLEYELTEAGFIYDTTFVPGGKNSILSWWGELERGRPLQGHNYVVAADISKGTGTSNSVDAVLDVNTNEIVGLLVTPYYSITDFAELTVALCEWVGGNIKPLLIWEENGASDFYKRITELGYYNMYVKEDVYGKKAKAKNKFGWRSTQGQNGTKIAVLNSLDAALNEGLRDKTRFKPIILYDKQTVNELESYVFFEGKIDVGPAAMQTETSGAKSAHGDRVIAIALANEGRKQMELGHENNFTFVKPGSFMARKEDFEREAQRRKTDAKQWWY